MAVVALAAATACAPSGGSGPAFSWTSTRLARSASPAGTVNRSGAWTDDDWFATLELDSPTGGPSSARLLFFPRTGPAGSTLGTPQELPAPGGAGLGGPLGEHIVAVPTGTGASFFRETAGVWAAAGSMTVPDGFQVADMTDRWLAARRVPAAPGSSGDGEVRIYAVDASGPTVVPTLATTLGPDPAWPAALREGFGRAVSLDGDLAAVSGSGLSGPTPGGVRVFRATAGTWSPVQSLGDGSSPQSFGNAITIEDGTTVDRLAISTNVPTLLTTGIEIHADDGSGFTLEQSLTPDPGQVDASGGLLFGSSLDLDGELLALTARSTTVASAEMGHAPVTVGHVQMFRRGPVAWSQDGEVGTFTVPYDADVASAYPYRLQVSGAHVAVTVLVNPDPPVGCTFPCFNLGLEAWSLDRV